MDSAVCYSDEENGHRVYKNGHLTTANQSEIRFANLVSVIATRIRGISLKLLVGT